MITACLICRDSAETIEACIRSLKTVGVDFLNVTDTGSKDKTKSLISKTCKKVHLEYKLTDFVWVDDFAAARNYNLQQAPPKTTWYLWLDSDDTITENEVFKMVKLLEEAPEEVGAIWLPYEYAFDEFNNVNTLFIRERLLRASVEWKWENRVHETVAAQEQITMVRNDEVRIKHHHTGGRNRSGRNFGLLRKMLEETPENLRTQLYMGHQFFAEGRLKEASEWYMKFGKNEEAVGIERYQALTYASRALRGISEFKQAVNCDLMAVEMYPQWADAYVGLLISYKELGQVEKAIHWGEQSYTKTPPDDLIFINPLDYSFNREVGLYEAYIQQGNIEAAGKHLDAAYSVRPTEELKEHVGHVQEARRREAALYGWKALSNALVSNGEIFKLGKLKEALPSWSEEIPEVMQVRAMIDGQVAGIPRCEKETTVIEDVLSVGADFFHSHTSYPYCKVAVCVDVLEHIDVPIDYALAKLEQFADTVSLRIGNGGVRKISQGEIERHILVPNRHIVDLYTDEKGLVVVYDHEPVQVSHGIKIFCGGGFEAWSPRTIEEKGCGGSEISVAWLAEELAKRHNRVMVYAEASGIYNKVLYRKQFNPAVPCDMMISSRVPTALAQEGDFIRVLWVHDVHCGPTLTPELCEQIDGIVALSRWHLDFLKATYPFLADAEVIDLRGDPQTFTDHVETEGIYADQTVKNLPKMFIICDSILPDRFVEWDQERVPHRFIWLSSPDRGLDHLLTMWPDIKAALPDATLKIFYGWEYFDKTLNNPKQVRLKEELQWLLMQDGIEWCGRVNPAQLARELKQADIWLYPPMLTEKDNHHKDFRETCCIAAMECQAAGVLCFYRENGALGETIGNRGIPLPLDWRSEQIIPALVSALTNTEECDRLRVAGREWAQSRTYEAAADRFLEVYEECKGE